LFIIPCPVRAYIKVPFRRLFSKEVRAVRAEASRKERGRTCMSAENKAMVRKFYAFLDKGDMTGISQLLSDKFVWHVAGIPAPFDKQSSVGFLQAFQAAFPDMQHSLDPQIAEGDRVVTSLTFRATHRGELMGVPASGKRVEMRALNIHRILEGKIAHAESVVDMMSLMQQIGAIPAPGGARA
jgi:steroid delta-isomerase-like uncharacterized protein